jgi:uncharacterized protein YndB with AHSA1/START domain
MTHPPQASSLGQVKSEGEFATLIFERRLHHPIDAVWQAITESGELSKWYFSRGKIETRLGGKVEFFLGPVSVVGSVLAWDPPHVFEHEWFVARPGAPKGEFGVIRWELESAGNETILKLTHRKLSSPAARDFVIGVHVRLDRLEAFLNNSPLPYWKKHLEDVRALYSK